MSKFLKSKNIFLKKISIDDNLNNYLNMVNEVNELKYIDELGRFPLNKKDLENYIENIAGLFLSIFNNDNNEHVGNIRVTDVHPTNRSCSFGILLYSKYRGNGYAKEASKLIIEHLFMNLNVKRVELYVAEQNKSAISLYESLGFVREGCKRESIWIKGEYDNLLIYSILCKEYKK
jgi:[ribosomal protein S5]-alanine N-acetyltransferase